MVAAAVDRVRRGRVQQIDTRVPLRVHFGHGLARCHLIESRGQVGTAPEAARRLANAVLLLLLEHRVDRTFVHGCLVLPRVLVCKRWLHDLEHVAGVALLGEGSLHRLCTS